MKDRILIKDAYLCCTFDRANRRLPRAYVVVQGGKIEEVGASWQGAFDGEVIDALGKILLPGLINVHHHFYQNLTRNVPAVQKCTLLDWLKYLYAIWAGVDAEVAYFGALVSIAELLLTGCTTTSDFAYLNPAGTGDLLAEEVRAARELGIRFHPVRGCLPAMEGDLPREIRAELGVDVSPLIEPKDKVLEASWRAIRDFHDPSPFSMCRVALGPTTVVYDDPEFMKSLKTLAAENGCLVHVHLHPRADEVAYCRQRYGKRPLEFLESIGWLDEGTWIAHATEHTQEDIGVLARNGAGVTHSPSCHMRLGCKVAPIPQMLRAGINVGIGVDGGASNDSGDMLGELRVAMFVHRIQGVHADAGVDDWLGPEDVFRLATVGGARVLGWETLGTIESGKAADLVLFDLQQIGYAGALADPLGALVYCGYSHRADLTMVNGRILVRDGKLTGMSEKYIVQNANRVAARLLDQAQAATGIDFRRPVSGRGKRSYT